MTVISQKMKNYSFVIRMSSNEGFRLLNRPILYDKSDGHVFTLKIETGLRNFARIGLNLISV